MTWNNRRIFRGCLLLVLALLVPLFLEPLAHASTVIGYTSANVSVQCHTIGQAHCSGSSVSTTGAGLSMKSPLAGQITAVSVDVGDIVPNLIIISTFTAGVNPAQTVGTCTNDVGHNCPFDTSSQSGYTVQDVESITIGSAGFSTILLSAPVTVALAQWVSATFLNSGGSIPPLQTCDVNCGTGGGSAINGVTSDTALAFGSSNPQVGSTPATSGQTGGCGCTISGTFVATGTSGGTVTVTQCYGNCGNPAITLANTNSTHSTNFNQSIMLFYQFQSNVNGFILNVTTNLAKSYTNGQILRFGVYLIPSCPLGQTPFSQQCPGLLTSAGSTQNLVKGKNTLTVGNVPVSNGQWVGIGVSAVFSGLDLNDTNTSVSLFQTNEGSVPNAIQAAIPSTAPSTPSKMGLWAWIKGNVVTGGPSTSPSSGACGPGLDFILTCVINSSCTLITISCQTGSSIFWIIILTVVTLMVTLAGFSYLLPSMNLSTRGMGEFAVLIFVGWFLVLASYNLLVPYAMILLFFIVSWLFLGRLRGTGPI